MMGPGSRITIAVAEKGYVLIHQRIYEPLLVEVYPSLEELKNALDYHLSKHDKGEENDT